MLNLSIAAVEFDYYIYGLLHVTNTSVSYTQPVSYWFAFKSWLTIKLQMSSCVLLLWPSRLIFCGCFINLIREAWKGYWRFFFRCLKFCCSLIWDAGSEAKEEGVALLIQSLVASLISPLIDLGFILIIKMGFQCLSQQLCNVAHCSFIKPVFGVLAMTFFFFLYSWTCTSQLKIHANVVIFSSYLIKSFYCIFILLCIHLKNIEKKLLYYQKF